MTAVSIETSKEFFHLFSEDTDKPAQIVDSIAISIDDNAIGKWFEQLRSKQKKVNCTNKREYYSYPINNDDQISPTSV